MDRTDKTAEREELRKEAALLPPGSRAAKKIRGKQYCYLRIREGDRRVETCIDQKIVKYDLANRN